MTRRVVGSVADLKTRRFTLGVLRQYPSNASTTSSTPGADRRLLEAVLTDLLDVLLGDDPGGAGGGRRVEGHEVRPRLLEPETEVGGVRRLHRRHFVLESL